MRMNREYDKHQDPRREKIPTDAEWEQAQQRAQPRQARCTFCGQPGHNIRTCPDAFKRTK